MSSPNTAMNPGISRVRKRSPTADLFRTRLIPGFITVFGLLIPSDIQAFYVTVRPG